MKQTLSIETNMLSKPWAFLGLSLEIIDSIFSQVKLKRKLRRYGYNGVSWNLYRRGLAKYELSISDFF